MAERKHQYQPAARLVGVLGVRVERSPIHDVYRGTKEQLVAMGIAPATKFPGEPGMPLISVTLWPMGTDRRSSWNIPGRLRLTRNPSRTYTAVLVVPEAEQRIRTSELKRRNEEERRANVERAAEGALAAPEGVAAKDASDLDRVAGTMLLAVVRQLGLSEVATRVDRLLRERRLDRPTSHLKLVWAVPQTSTDRPRPQ